MSKISSLSVLFKWNKVKTSCSKTSPRSRCKQACCLHNEYIYMIGGKDGNVSLKDFWRFNIGTNKWEELTYIYKGENIPYFEGHSFVPHKRLLLLFGGVFGYDNTESALWIVNPDLKYIRKHIPDAGSLQPCTRRNHTALVYNNVMYVYGGFLDLKGSTSEIWAYHIDDEDWELITPKQRTVNTAGSRHGHSAVLHGREMWVYGGMSGLQTKSDFWRFNFYSLKWDRIKTKFGPPCLSGHTASVVKEYMMITGGESNGTLSSDIWVFGFCTLKWTRYQNSHHYPSPRKWHAIIPITARYRKGDNSVRTKSLPYLQKKGQNKIVTRPRSSPVYSSARLPRKSPEAVESIASNRPITLPLKMTNDTNQVNSTSQPIEMTDLHNRNSDRRSPYKGNGFSEKNSKQAEDTSPLLANRQLSRDSVASNNSSLGTDNPCLELDSSCEKLDNFENRCCDDSKFLVSFELKDFSDKKETMSSANSEKQLVTRYVKNNKQMFHTSHIPGQVNLSPPKTETLYKKVNIDQNTGSDLIVEDLEFYDNYFSINSQHGDHRHQRFTHVNRKKRSSNQDLKIKNSSDSEFCETELYGRTHVKREIHLEEKSYSMNDITKTHLIQNDSLASRSRSMHVPQLMSCRKCSLNCWMEEAENSNEDDSLTPVDVDNGTTVASQVLIDDVKETDTQTKTNEVQERDKEVIIENGSPYFLLFGGLEEKKGHTISIEPITVWQCDVMVRHSDISHGEYYKSNLVV